MRTLATFGVVTVCIVALACGKKDDSPQAVSPQGGYQQGGYPQQGQFPQQQQQFPQQQGQFPQQGAPPPTAPAPGPAPVTPAQPGQMATPGPLALPCTNDQGCGLAHCNVQFQKCAFPCQSAVDCIQGASCNTMSGLCLPGGG